MRQGQVGMPARMTISATDAAMTSAADRVGGTLRTILMAIRLTVDSSRHDHGCALPGGNYPSNS
ncbi:hypothetical protein RHCRD62_10282 [Rhodococcus sp. RD6.2]|nr:hypothetical protein RHCRD62_10282 [Rhodococcus sp. RD6.2]